MSDCKHTEQNNEGVNNQSSHNILVTFFSALLICCGLYGYAIYLHNGHIVEGQNRIIRTYSQQLERIESRRNSINIRDNQREKEMEAFHQEVKSLLELEYNRIQNEFEAVEIWTGILTVIFLIFSFYSLFKTEQLENQSKNELLRIKKISEDGNRQISEFNKVSTEGLNNLTTAVEKILNDSNEQIRNLLGTGQKESLKVFDERAKAILEAYEVTIKDMLKANLKVIEKTHDVYKKQLQSIADKDILPGDSDEDELDEEELIKDKEREDEETLK